MTSESIELLAHKHKVDFLVIEDNLHESLNLRFAKEFPTIFIKAPYMPISFIKDMEKCRPVTLDFKYARNTGVVHWLAWKLRTSGTGKKVSVKIISSSPCEEVPK